ncbi:MAG: 6-carboxytetrahydropterin synthase [Clostridiales bacterium]|jgi:6-pyruvoyltetrahydropterin/6-carboxytetrahydropterin synthase|nr:6-carboxytetrahydropterin synthase [Clostridiales bacterium]
MFKIRSEVQFDMAHYLSGYQGKCSNIHGHRYRLIATFAAKELHQEGQLRGMVDDFTVVKQALKEIEDAFDHKLVIEENEEGRRLQQELSGYTVVLVPYRPTAESMAQDIYRRLTAKGLPVYEVELFETPTNSCIYSEVE